MGIYDNKAWDLHTNLSYAECRELLDLAIDSKTPPADRLQELENNMFNIVLDKLSYNKFKWAYKPKPLNLWQIKKIAKTEV